MYKSRRGDPLSRGAYDLIAATRRARGSRFTRGIDVIGETETGSSRARLKGGKVKERHCPIDVSRVLHIRPFSADSMNRGAGGGEFSHLSRVVSRVTRNFHSVKIIHIVIWQSIESNVRTPSVIEGVTRRARNKYNRDGASPFFSMMTLAKGFFNLTASEFEQY